MSQAYILRRDGRDYQAPDLETMRRWAQDGRVLPTDMVYSPRYQSWYRARDLRELRDVLPQAEATAPPPTVRPPQQFWLRKGDENYATESIEGILRWAEEGNISPDDYIYHPAYGKWFRAGDSPQLVSRFPAHITRTPPFLPDAEDPMRRDGNGADSVPTLDAVLEEEEAAGAGAVEGADSLARTVMDFRAADLHNALRRQAAAAQPRAEVEAEAERQPGEGAGPNTRRGMGIVKPGRSLFDQKPSWSRPDGEVIEKPLEETRGGAAEPKAQANDAAGPRTGQPRTTPFPGLAQAPAERIAPAEQMTPESAADLTPAAPVEAAQAEPEPTAAEPEPEPPEAAPADDEPADDEPAAPTTEQPDAAIDENARYTDRLGLMRLFYDVARAFVVTRDLRPGELLENKCKLPSTGDDFHGQAKRIIYTRLRERMEAHLEGAVLEAHAQLTDDEVPGYRRFVHVARALVETFRTAEEVIGKKPPERVVVGNVGRPKMSPEEEHALLEMDAALKNLVRVKAKDA